MSIIFQRVARVSYQLACICWLMQGFINQIHKMVLGAEPSRWSMFT